jgi:Flp pilus assembly pilin Flp
MMIFMWLLSFIRRESGENLVEYALLGGLIALAITGVAIMAYSDGITDMFEGIGRCIDFNSDTDCAV